MITWLKRIIYNRTLTRVAVELAAARQTQDHLNAVFWECIEDREVPPPHLKAERIGIRDRIALLESERDHVAGKLLALDDQTR